MNPQQNDPWVTFGYEVEMFRRLSHHLGPGSQTLAAMPWEIRCAVTESALLHARQLVDILLSRTSEATDIKLKDIMPGFQPTRLEELRQSYGDRNGGICHTLNKYAMHPSYLRSEKYDYTLVLQELGNVIEDIVSKVERRRSATAFDWTGGGKSTATVKVSTSATTTVPDSYFFKP